MRRALGTALHRFPLFRQRGKTDHQGLQAAFCLRRSGGGRHLLVHLALGPYLVGGAFAERDIFLHAPVMPIANRVVQAEVVMAKHFRVMTRADIWTGQ
jgi:hypothetical protein